jgi:hypothetical protein
METFMALAGLLWIICGTLVLLVAKSGIHEILACLALSFGVLFLGICGVLAKMREATADLKAVNPPQPNAAQDPKPPVSFGQRVRDDSWKLSPRL